MIKQKDNIIWFKLNGFLRYALAHTLSGVLPLYIVNEYPKSGGSWIGDMLSDLLEIPFPRNRLPYLKSCILHGHMMHSWNMNNVLIVWRDGRDVLVSQYYHSLFRSDRGNARLVRECRSDLGFTDYEDITKNLPAFMKYVYEDKKHPKNSWLDFGKRWAGNSNYIHVKYEDIRVDPANELYRVATELTGRDISFEKVTSVVKKHSFFNQSGRKPGEENTRSFLRKGIVGDWKNHFNQEAREKFNNYAGEQLIKLRYEIDDSWVTVKGVK